MSIITYLFLISFTICFCLVVQAHERNILHKQFISDVSATFKVIEWLGPPSLNSFLFCLVLFFTARRSSIWVRLFLATIPSLLWPSFLREQKTTVSFQKRDHYQSNWNLSYILGFHTQQQYYIYMVLYNYTKNKSPILALCHHYSRRCPL